jgi:hypothetical protein
MSQGFIRIIGAELERGLSDAARDNSQGIFAPTTSLALSGPGQAARPMPRKREPAIPPARFSGKIQRVLVPSSRPWPGGRRFRRTFRDAPRSASRGRKRKTKLAGAVLREFRAHPPCVASPPDRRLSPEMKDSKTECTILREFCAGRRATSGFGEPRHADRLPQLPQLGEDRMHDSQGIFEGVLAA